ncbi:MAG: hypothetical protein ABJN26_02160 [Stappiaceae bacterium]
MPSETNSTVLAKSPVRTVKQCPPFIDAMRLGVLFPLAADLSFSEGEFSWDWPLPRHEQARTTRSPIGVHVPDQAKGMPEVDEQAFVIKFNNFWTIDLPEGWSMLFSHPANRSDLPFRTLSGLVDCDQWKDGFVHFPAQWIDPSFNGTLPAGTPVAQGWLVKREPLELQTGEMGNEALKRHLEVQDSLQRDSGLYRKSYRVG